MRTVPYHAPAAQEPVRIEERPFPLTAFSIGLLFCIPVWWLVIWAVS